MIMATMLKSVAEVIEKIGPRNVAQLVNVGLPAVSNAKKAGHLPYRWRIAICQEAERRGLEIEPELIGFSAKGEAA